MQPSSRASSARNGSGRSFMIRFTRARCAKRQSEASAFRSFVGPDCAPRNRRASRVSLSAQPGLPSRVQLVRRIRASTRPKRPGAATCSSCTIDAGTAGASACIGMCSASASRPYLVKTTRSSVAWHSEQRKVWCSKPGTESGTTFIRINSAPHAVQRIAPTPISAHLSSTRRHAGDYSRSPCDPAVRCYVVNDAKGDGFPSVEKAAMTRFRPAPAGDYFARFAAAVKTA
jgi:hypothetical protein